MKIEELAAQAAENVHDAPVEDWADILTEWFTRVALAAGERVRGRVMQVAENYAQGARMEGLRAYEERDGGKQDRAKGHSIAAGALATKLRALDVAALLEGLGIPDAPPTGEVKE